MRAVDLDDLVLEMARLTREARLRASQKVQDQQEGIAWLGLEVGLKNNFPDPLDFCIQVSVAS